MIIHPFGSTRRMVPTKPLPPEIVIIRDGQLEANVQLPRGRVRSKRAVETVLRRIEADLERLKVLVAEWSDEMED